jgi:hypothetical protein
MSKQQMLISNLISQLGEVGDARMVGLDPGGGGGWAVQSVNGKTGSVVLDAGDVGASPAETVVAVSGTTPTITPADNTIYNCGEVASLTISNPPATGAYSIVFTSGATPTQVIIPPKPAMRWQTDDNEPPQGFPAANTRYEINVKNTYVVLSEWPVPEVSA